MAKRPQKTEAVRLCIVCRQAINPDRPDEALPRLPIGDYSANASDYCETCWRAYVEGVYASKLDK